jgi:hypothetical protein
VRAGHVRRRYDADRNGVPGQCSRIETCQPLADGKTQVNLGASESVVSFFARSIPDQDEPLKAARPPDAEAGIAFLHPRLRTTLQGN